MKYFYAPLDPNVTDARKPDGDIPPRVRSLLFDEQLSRFVLVSSWPGSHPLTWSPVDAALIEADYPGLLGGA